MKSLDHVNIDSENSLYFIFNNGDGYIEYGNGEKYLVFVSTDKSKEVLKKYTELQDEIKNQIKTINGAEPIEYKKDFMKIGFGSVDALLLGKILNIRSMIIVTRFVFQEDNKYFLQVYLHECVYKSVGEL